MPVRVGMPPGSSILSWSPTITGVDSAVSLFVSFSWFLCFFWCSSNWRNRRSRHTFYISIFSGWNWSSSGNGNRDSLLPSLPRLASLLPKCEKAFLFSYLLDCYYITISETLITPIVIKDTMSTPKHARCSKGPFDGISITLNGSLSIPFFTDSASSLGSIVSTRWNLLNSGKEYSGLKKSSSYLASFLLSFSSSFPM